MRRDGIRIGWLNVNTAAAKLALAVVVASVAYGLGKDSWGQQLVLTPRAVIEHAAAWQFLSYGFIASDPLSLIFGVLIIWQIGSALEATWGSRKFFAVVGGITILSGVLTVVLSLLVQRISGFPFFGSFVMSSVIWVAYGL